LNKTIFFSLILLLIIPTAYVYAGGTRGDYDERYEDIPGGPDCWLEGYDAGFTGKYDQSRANECLDLGDQYNRAWKFGCKDAEYTLEECANPAQTQTMRNITAYIHFNEEAITQDNDDDDLGDSYFTVDGKKYDNTEMDMSDWIYGDDPVIETSIFTEEHPEELVVSDNASKICLESGSIYKACSWLEQNITETLYIPCSLANHSRTNQRMQW
jgi:hypothetical protein